MVDFFFLQCPIVLQSFFISFFFSFPSSSSSSFFFFISVFHFEYLLILPFPEPNSMVTPTIMFPVLIFIAFYFQTFHFLFSHIAFTKLNFHQLFSTYRYNLLLLTSTAERSVGLFLIESWSSLMKIF